MTAAKKISSQDIKDHVLDHVSKVVNQITGIQLGDRQKSMVESRLKNRMLEIGLQSFEDYLEHFDSHANDETQALISLLTTHHTYFFREFAHFEYLESTAIPALINEVRQRPDKKIKIWSAACSRGQEVYSLAMFMQHLLARIAPDVKYEILGTDVDPESVQIAKNGVYRHKEIKEVPLVYLGQHWARGTKEIADFVKAKDTLKTGLRFMPANLLNFDAQLRNETFDIIFCRNVYIYFTPAQIKDITTNIMNHLSPNGFFFVGISESLNGLNLNVSAKGPSVYQHKMAAKPTEPRPTPSVFGKNPTSTTTANAMPTKPTPAATPSLPPPFVMPDVLRVLCVDDSASILTLLKKILAKEQGFEIIGTAGNGLEAAQKMKELKPDVVTLDIHMPEQTGIEYLEKNYGPNHAPVVMLTSVSRDNADLALRALTLGASDYVEKPALNNIVERGDEIRMKLRSAYKNKKLSGEQKNLSLDKEFQKLAKITNPEKKLRIVVASLGDRHKVAQMIKEAGPGQPPTVYFVEGSDSALVEFNKQFSKQTGKSFNFCEQFAAGQLKVDGFYLADFKKSFDSLKTLYGKERTSILVYGEISKVGSEKLLSWMGAQLLVEDPGPKQKHHLKDVATDVVPATSFAYMSIEFLSQEK